MINFIRKLFIKKPYICCMELHNQLGCYLSLKIPSEGPLEGWRGFYEDNHFIIAHNIFDPNLEDEIQTEEIYNKISYVYDFNPRENNIAILKGEKKIYLLTGYYVEIPPGGVVVYNKNKINIRG